MNNIGHKNKTVLCHTLTARVMEAESMNGKRLQLREASVENNTTVISLRAIRFAF